MVGVGMWVLMVLALGSLAEANRKGFQDPFFAAATQTFVAMSHEDIHRIPDPVNVHGMLPAASIIARPPSPPPPVEFGERPYLPPPQTNFSIYLRYDQQFDLCFFLNMNIPPYMEIPDFRVLNSNGAIVVQNEGFKRMKRKVMDNRRRMEEGDPPTFEELNEPPAGFYPVQDLSARCVSSTPLGPLHVVSVDVEVDYPLRLFSSNTPMLELTAITNANRPNVTTAVSNMKESIERGLEMFRHMGPPMLPPPMMRFPGPPPPGPAPFPFMPPPMPLAPEPETRSFESSRRPSSQASSSTQSNSNSNSQWMPTNPFQTNRNSGNPWVSTSGGNAPRRSYRGLQK